MHSSLVYNPAHPSPLRPVSNAQARGHDGNDSLPNHGNHIPHPALSLPNWVSQPPKKCVYGLQFLRLVKMQPQVFMQERKQWFLSFGTPLRYAPRMLKAGDGEGYKVGPRACAGRSKVG